MFSFLVSGWLAWPACSVSLQNLNNESNCAEVPLAELHAKGCGESAHGRSARLGGECFEPRSQVTAQLLNMCVARFKELCSGCTVNADMTEMLRSW